MRALIGLSVLVFDELGIVGLVVDKIENSLWNHMFEVVGIVGTEIVDQQDIVGRLNWTFVKLLAGTAVGVVVGVEDGAEVAFGEVGVGVEVEVEVEVGVGVGVEVGAEVGVGVEVGVGG